MRICRSLSRDDLLDGGLYIIFVFCMLMLSSSLLSKNLKIKILRTVILPVVLYGCETWSLTLKEEHRLRVSENRVLRRIFGPKRDGGNRKMEKIT